MNESCLEIKNLSKEFTVYNANKVVKACENINLSLQKGEFIGITGRSGSGKSTILKGIYRTNYPQKGEIFYESDKYGWIDLCKATERQIVHLRKHEIGYVSQFLKIMPRTTARQLVENAVLETGGTEIEAKEKATIILKHFDLDETLWDAYPNTFSGGEKLRVNIAMAMVKKPKLLLLDEPTASLDNASKVKVRTLIEQLKNEGTTMLGIFHDLEFMEGLCDKEFNMQKGVIEK
ncbi:phosphonate C-P lyase system protein PhnL [Anaerorhabdus sp.]|uniref:phosphonate C-P lyase system protein PhnL n=1 Tax=Anaerorhabdus sp. TaxID=1872524 RepID=UPI002FC59869